MWKILLVSYLIGYLAGSINPAFILGKILKGIDIRKYGDKNAGAMNSFKVLGKVPGAVALTYDLAKGILAMLIVYWIFSTNLPLQNIFMFLPAYFAGISAVIGHNWPFYLGFKGGKGLATTSGLILFMMIFIAMKLPINLWPVLVIFAILELFILIFFRDLTILGLSSFPFLFIFAIKYSPSLLFEIFLIILASIVFFMALNNIQKLKIRNIKLNFWRKMLRCLAVIFPITYFFISKAQILWFAGIVLGIILIPEIARLTAPKSALAKFWKRTFFKEKEEKMKISAITLFLISTFIIILFFERNIAIAAILIMLFGDMAAGIIGKLFGKHIIVRETHKTFEGFLAFFWTSFFLSLVLASFINLNIYLLLIASLFAAATELYSYEIDDNLSVGLIAAIAMAAFRTFV